MAEFCLSRKKLGVLNREQFVNATSRKVFKCLAMKSLSVLNQEDIELEEYLTRSKDSECLTTKIVNV